MDHIFHSFNTAAMLFQNKLKQRENKKFHRGITKTTRSLSSSQTKYGEHDSCSVDQNSMSTTSPKKNTRPEILKESP